MGVVQGPDSNREEQLNQMILQHEKDLLRICCIYLRDTALAEDAVQEVFLKAYKGLEDFRGDCSQKTWLIHIAMNVCKDFRRNAWYRYVDRRVSLERLPAPSSPPTLEHMALTAEIMRLSRKQMEAVILYYYQNLNIREIAEALGISTTAVSERLNKARRRLRGFLEGGTGNDE